MLRNAGAVHFEDVTVESGLGHLQKGHGIAFNDLDHDGDQDIYHQLGGFFPADGFHNALFQNPGNDGHYLKLLLRGRRSNRLGLGARVAVELETAAGIRTIHRAAGSVSSFGGSSLGRLEVGLGDAKRILKLTILWPASKTRSVYRDVPFDAMIAVVEGAPSFERLRHNPLPLLAPRRADKLTAKATR